MSLPLKIFVIIPFSLPTLVSSSAVPMAMAYRCNYFNARAVLRIALAGTACLR